MCHTVIPVGHHVDYFPVDFSIRNPYWKHHDITLPLKQQQYLKERIKAKGKSIGYGGFLEERGLYRGSARFQNGAERNIHLGLDIWASAGMAVCSVLSGKLHSVGILRDKGNYGGVVIMEHDYQGKPIYVLYGHLSHDSIKRFLGKYRFRERETDKISTSLIAIPEQPVLLPKNFILGKLGVPEENGGYAPHLHFQVIKDLGGFVGDYPGVASKEELLEIQDNLMDPGKFLGLY